MSTGYIDLWCFQLATFQFEVVHRSELASFAMYKWPRDARGEFGHKVWSKMSDEMQCRLHVGRKMDAAWAPWTRLPGLPRLAVRERCLTATNTGRLSGQVRRPGLSQGAWQSVPGWVGSHNGGGRVGLPLCGSPLGAQAAMAAWIARRCWRSPWSRGLLLTSQGLRPEHRGLAEKAIRGR